MLGSNHMTLEEYLMATWLSRDDDVIAIDDCQEIEKAFSLGGATYGIFWKRNADSNQYEQCGTYERAANSLSRELRGGESYLTKSAGLR